MLLELSIKDFAIIQTLNLSFENGMTVLTGETGAGKSIIIDAIGLLIGGRSSVNYIREGAKKTVLQGLFSIVYSNRNDDIFLILKKYGIDLDDDQLLISREINQNGRNVIRINGIMITGAGLREIGQYLIDIHGQNGYQDLMQVDQHKFLLDTFAQKELKLVLEQYQDAFKDYQKCLKLYKQRQNDEKSFVQRINMLKFQINELQEADLKIDEEELLNQEYKELSNFQDVTESLSTAYEVLAGEFEGNGLNMINQSVNALEKIEELGPRYKTLTETIREAYFELQEASLDALSIRDNLEFDSERLVEVTERLNLINNLESKYGSNISDILIYQEEIEEELMKMTENGSELSDLKDKLLQSKKIVQKLADKLTEIRKLAAINLTKEIHKQLTDLFMTEAVFSVHLEAIKEFNITGQDKVEFYIKTNTGESSKPLAKVASGGELSRIMLAMKTIFMRNQGMTSIIFDEVDTGVSGRIAQAIANKFVDMASYSQIIVITHLPQVASVANQHLYIKKDIIKKRTITTVKYLNENERVDELARMLSGNKLTNAARANARDLLI